jgi:hypothetical protein
MQNHLDERSRRIWAASEAEALGHGGVTIVHSDRRSAGNRYVKKRHYSGSGTTVRWRSEKKISEKYPRYERELESLLDTSVIGNP